MKRREHVSAIEPTIADVILCGGAVVSVLALIYFVYHYGWNRDRSFTTPTGLIAYYGFPAAVAALLFAALKLKLSQKILFAYLFLAVVVLAYGAEIFFYSSQHEKPRHSKEEIVRLAKQSGIYFDTRDVSQVVAQLRTRDSRAIGPLPGVLDTLPNGMTKSAITIRGAEVIPLSAISGVTMVVCNQNGQYLTYRSDEHGFHNPAGIWKSDRLQIAAVGNAPTQGYCVQSDENYVAVIRQHYSATLNLGMAGDGPLRMLATIKEYLPRFKPKTVLWFYYTGHLVYLGGEKKSALLMNYLKRDFSQDLLARQNDIDAALMELNNKVESRKEVEPQKISGPIGKIGELLEIGKLGRVRQKLGLVFGSTPAELDRSVELDTSRVLLREILLEANKIVTNWGGILYFIYLPSFESYDNGGAEFTHNDWMKTLSLVTSLRIPVIDLYSVFRAQNDPLALFPFRRSGHYNQKGHRLVAEEVIKTIGFGS